MLILFVSIAIILLIFNLLMTFSIIRKQQQNTDFDSKLEQLKENLSRFETIIRDEFSRNREEFSRQAKEGREEISTRFQEFTSSFSKQWQQVADSQNKQFDAFGALIRSNMELFTKAQNDKAEEQHRRLDDFSKVLNQRLSELNTNMETRFQQLTQTVEKRLENIQNDNTQKLELIRQTVDEKLSQTLEKRLGESFKQVSDRLEQVHKGLGEMQNLATGVGDLKRVLTNIKSRGVIGEIQLHNLLEQVLTPEQYVANYKPKKNLTDRDLVEYAIKLPGKDDDNENVYLPIDSKFPVEDYYRLLDTFEKGDMTEIDLAQKQLSSSIRKCAKDIQTKYINPPNTTDFGLLFLPFEGLYAEVLRQAGLFEEIQRDYHVVITGPTTLAALLNSLQMGFRTLAIEKRSGEVWNLLGAVKKQFGLFGEILSKTQKKLQEANNVIEKAQVRSRSIERHLRTVQELPQNEAERVLDYAGDDDLYPEDKDTDE